MDGEDRAPKLQDKTSCEKGPPDGGYGWVIVMVASFLSGITMGIGKSTAIIYTSVIEEFHVSRTEASVLPSVGRAITFIFCLVVGKLLQIFTYKSIIITGGFTLGISYICGFFVTNLGQLVVTESFSRVGLSCIMNPSALMVGFYFEKRRSLALGIMFCAAGGIGFFMPFLFEILISKYAIQGTYLIFGAIFLNTCALGQLVRQPTWIKSPTKSDENNLKDAEQEEEELRSFLPAKTDSGTNVEEHLTITLQKENEMDNHKEEKSTVMSKNSNFKMKSIWLAFIQDVKSDCELFSDPSFLLLLFSRVTQLAAILSVQTIILDFFEWEVSGEVTKMQSASLASSILIGDTMSRFLTGSLVDHLPWQKQTVFAGLSIVLGILIVCMQFADGYVTMLILCAVFGILGGGGMLTHFLLMLNLLGPKAPMALGIMQLTGGLVALVFGLLLGYIKDSRGSYSMGFTLTGVLAMFGGSLWVCERIVTKRTLYIQKQEKVINGDVPKNLNTLTSDMGSTLTI